MPHSYKQNSPSSQQHLQHAEQQIQSVRLAIITVSDSRTPETDTNGQYLQGSAQERGMQVVLYRVIPDDPEQVAACLEEGSQAAEVILFNGGTGISTRDRTFDVLSEYFEKRIPGFGELFRMLSYQQVGASAMLSRAAAGLYHNRLVFCIPGSNAAVQLAWETLIADQLAHMLWELRR